MTDQDWQGLWLSRNARTVAEDLVSLGAVVTSGHRDSDQQAHAMAVMVAQKRDWIRLTYLHGAPLQALVDAHPEWQTEADFEAGFTQAFAEDPGLLDIISHHLRIPCPCFDLAPASITPAVRNRITDYMGTQGYNGLRIVKVLWQEGGYPKCHIEVVELPTVKVEEV